MKGIEREQEFCKYIEILKTLQNKIIIIAVCDTIGFHVGEDGYRSLKQLGLSKLNGTGNLDYLRGYVAVLLNGEVLYEELGKLDESIEFEGIVEDCHIEVCSSPLRSANRASIVIGENEYAVNKRGFNIVIVDVKDNVVIDSVAFDTWAEGRPCSRKISLQKTVVLPQKRNSLKLRHINEVRERLKIENIIENINNYRKIKVRFYFWGAYILWNAVESVAQMFQRDDRFDVLVVVDAKGEEGEKNKKRIDECKIRNINSAQYEIQTDCPEIAIYNNFAIIENYNFNSIKFRINMPSIIVNGMYKNVAAITMKNKIFGEKDIKVDIAFVEKIIYEKIKEFEDCNCVSSGNPKFDLIYNHVNHKQKCPEEWGKLVSKKIILWAFDHNWDTANVTFDLYIKAFLQYAKEHSKMGLIIRPHYTYICELLGKKIWSESDLETIKTYCNQTPNVVWDDTFDYGMAYSMADAVITDMNCGITVSALTLGKPLAVLKRFDGNICEPLYPELIENLYQIESVKELHKFFEMVQRGEDTMYDLRQKMFEQYISHFDGKNGQRIKDMIVEKYFEKCAKEKENK